MEIRQLRYFVAVAEERHFRRAAARLHVAQPAISEQIRKLEAELGVVLLDRGPRRVEVTPAGVAFLDEARQVLRGVDGAAHAARRAEALAGARIRLGFTLPALPTPVTHVLGRLRTARAAIAVELAPGSSRGLLERLRRGELDAAVVCLPAPLVGLRVVELCREPLVAVTPAGPAAARPARLADLAARVVLPARELDPACHDATLAAFHLAGVVPQAVTSSATTLEHLLLEVLGGTGAAILPASAAARAGLPGLVARPLVGTDVAVPMAIAARDEAPSSVVSRLLDELSRAADQRLTVAA
jgi:DNA-binding transcriptional LysR family regulator